MINKFEKEKLFTGLGSFLVEFRSYIISFLQERAKNEWVKDFEKTLKKDQERNWQKDLRRGIKPEELIDFHHLNAFAEEYKSLLKRDFPGNNQSLPTWLMEIATVRHKLMHHNGIEEDEAAKIWIHLRTIAKILGKSELERELVDLEKNKSEIPSQHLGTPKADIDETKLPAKIETQNSAINLRKPSVNNSSSVPEETLDIVNCAGDNFRKIVFSHNVYLCPAQGGAFSHRQCKYLGVYWAKHVGAVAEIEAVVDVHSESESEIYWINGNQPAEEYINRAIEKALQLRPNDLPIRVFLLDKIYPTNLEKDSPGGMFGSKIYIDIDRLEVTNAQDLAEKLDGKMYSGFGK